MVNPHGPTILYLLSSVIYAMVKTTRASGDVGRLRHLFWELRELRELLLVALNCIASMLSQGPSSSGPNWMWPNLPKTVLACRVSAIYGLAFNWRYSTSTSCYTSLLWPIIMQRVPDESYKDGSYVDLGAMRFAPYHFLVLMIAEVLGLQLTDFANLDQVTKLSC